MRRRPRDLLGCKKCGQYWDPPARKWHEDGTCPLNAFEHIHYKCSCGFEWTCATADAASKGGSA